MKFRDDFKVRAQPDGTLTSLVGGDLSNVDAVQIQYGLTFEQSIQLPQATLDFVETQAAQRSGVAQPDLAGMMVVRGPDETIEAAAQALLAVTRSMCVTVVAPCLLLLAIPPAIAQTGKRRGIGERVRRGFSVVAWRFSNIKAWR